MSMDRSGILVVEDQLLLGMNLSMSLEREGFEPLGPCMSVDDAFDVLADATPQAAILDVNLGSGATSAPIASELQRRGVPFAFLTAYGGDNPIRASFPDVPLEDKPVTDIGLRRLLNDLLQAPV